MRSLLHALFCILDDQGSDQAGPPRLMTRANPSAVVTVKVFVEQNVVTPVGIGLKRLTAAIDRATTRAISLEQGDQPLRKGDRDVSQRHVLSRPGGTFNLKIIAPVMVKSPKSFDN
jgi:hypothetical protein